MQLRLLRLSANMHSLSLRVSSFKSAQTTGLQAQLCRSSHPALHHPDSGVYISRIWTNYSETRCNHELLRCIATCLNSVPAELEGIKICSGSSWEPSGWYFMPCEGCYKVNLAPESVWLNNLIVSDPGDWYWELASPPQSPPDQWPAVQPAWLSGYLTGHCALYSSLLKLSESGSSFKGWIQHSS